MHDCFKMHNLSKFCQTFMKAVNNKYLMYLCKICVVYGDFCSCEKNTLRKTLKIQINFDRNRDIFEKQYITIY